MKDTRISYLIPVGAAVALLVLSLMVYAGFLTSDWGTLGACVPAILVTIGVVGGMTCGMLFFESEEEETPEEAARLDGTAIFDWLGARLALLVRRFAH
jgi:hypothetical protein